METGLELTELRYQAAGWETERRLIVVRQLARDFYARPTANVPQACASRATTKAAYRFLDHPEARMDTLLQPHPATERRLDLPPAFRTPSVDGSLDTWRWKMKRVPKRSYTEQYKQEAVKLTREVGPAEVARRLEMPAKSLATG